MMRFMRRDSGNLPAVALERVGEGAGFGHYVLSEPGNVVGVDLHRIAGDAERRDHVAARAVDRCGHAAGAQHVLLIVDGIAYALYASQFFAQLPDG